MRIEQAIVESILMTPPRPTPRARRRHGLGTRICRCSRATGAASVIGADFSMAMLARSARRAAACVRADALPAAVPARLVRPGQRVADWSATWWTSHAWTARDGARARARRRISSTRTSTRRGRSTAGSERSAIGDGETPRASHIAAHSHRRSPRARSRHAGLRTVGHSRAALHRRRAIRPSKHSAAAGATRRSSSCFTP